MFSVLHSTRKLDLITVVSSMVKKILCDNGVTTPIVVVGNGVDHLVDVEPSTRMPLGKGFRFLHISSCFPRKGVDLLLKAWGQAFRKRDDVSLIIKTFPNPHNDIERQLAAYQSTDPDYPDVVLINEDLPFDSAVAALYRNCHAFVAPKSERRVLVCHLPRLCWLGCQLLLLLMAGILIFAPKILLG